MSFKIPRDLEKSYGNVQLENDGGGEKVCSTRDVQIEVNGKLVTFLDQFYDAVGIADYTALNDEIIGEL
jgi:hypothetical protein